jgi:hypothetical protein
MESWGLTMEPWRLTLEPWRLTLKPSRLNLKLCVEAQPGVVEAGVTEDPHRAMEAYPGTIEAHPGAKEAHPKPLRPTL